MAPMSRVMCIALIALGCGHPSPPPRQAGTTHITAAPPDAAALPLPLDRDLPRLAERGSKLLADLAAAFAAAGEDCAVAITKLAELRGRYADVIAANAQVLRDGRAADLRVALAAHEDESSISAKAIVESKTMAACAKDHAFTQAFDDLVAPP